MLYLYGEFDVKDDVEYFEHIQQYGTTLFKREFEDNGAIDFYYIDKDYRANIDGTFYYPSCQFSIQARGGYGLGIYQITAIFNMSNPIFNSAREQTGVK